MIRHKQITTKTDTATLTLAEMGTIIANKATAFTITIPAASGYTGLWYEVINIGAGKVTVTEDGVGDVIELIQNESSFIVCDGTNWHETNNAFEAQKVDIADAGNKITATQVEGALQENRTAINLNTTHRGSNGSDHSYIDQDVTNGSSPEFTSPVLTTPIINTKQTTVGGASQDAATLGAELVTNGTFPTDLTGWTISDTGTKWTWDATAMAIHNGDGNTETISQNVNVTLNEYYVLAYKIAGRSAGSIVPSLNGVGGYLQSVDGTYYFSWKATATAAHSLMFTPTGTFDGKLDDVSFKQITVDMAAIIELKDSGSTISAEMRSGTNTLYNFFIGKDSGKNNYNGYQNISIGYAAMYNNTTGFTSVAIGYHALYSNIAGNRNVAIGYDAMYNNTTGFQNISIGYAAMYNNTTGFQNISAGYTAMLNNTTGYNGVAIGYRAMSYSQTGNNNIAIGNYSLGYGIGAVFTAASNHTIIGYQAGYNIGTNASANVMIGYQAGYNETSSNRLYISNTNTATPLIYGEFDNAVLGLTARVGINTKTPNANAALDITSTTKAAMLPRMTTAQKNAIPAPTEGMEVYDLTLRKKCVYTTAWENITSA